MRKVTIFFFNFCQGNRLNLLVFKSKPPRHMKGVMQLLLRLQTSLKLSSFDNGIKKCCKIQIRVFPPQTLSGAQAGSRKTQSEWKHRQGKFDMQESSCHSYKNYSYRQAYSLIYLLFCLYQCYLIRWAPSKWYSRMHNPEHGVHLCTKT